jgi:hypothetical protein
MDLISKENNLYKGLKKYGFTDFPSQGNRVLYYKENNIEFAITIKKSNPYKKDKYGVANDKETVLKIEQFK